MLELRPLDNTHTRFESSGVGQADIDLLHGISTELIAEQDHVELYGKIVDAAVAITGSQFGTMQLLCPEGDPSGNGGKLNLLCSRGIPEEAVEFWRWVGPEAHSTCINALKSGQREIVPDYEDWDVIAGTEDLLAFRRSGIRSAQTTPLLSRDGNLLGMISTHWSEPHVPSDRDLRLLDILARQAADLLERTIAEEARRAIEQEKAYLLERSEALVKQNQMLLEEMRHRVANSLQIIASILLLKSRAVSSDETRFHLQDAHQRVMSVAVVQQLLDTTDGIDQIDVGIYLEKLCAGLSASMVDKNKPIELVVHADKGMIPSANAISLGLIATELVINAIKHAFPDHPRDAAISISYLIEGDDWSLIVADNGVGKSEASKPKADGGLGTSIVSALAKQLKAVVATQTSRTGFSVTIGHKEAAKPLPLAA